MPTTAEEFVKELSDFIFGFGKPDKNDYFKMVIRRDILLFGWWFQKKRRLPTIPYHLLHKYVCVNNNFAFMMALSEFAPFCVGNIQTDFKFNDELIKAIESDTHLFFGATSFFGIDQILPGYENKSKKLTGLDFIEIMNKLDNQNQNEKIDVIVKNCLETLIPKLGVVLSNDGSGLIQIQPILANKFIMYVKSDDGTFYDDVEFFKYIEILSSKKVLPLKTLWVFPSIDDPVSNIIDSTYANHYAMSAIHFIAFLHLLHISFNDNQRQEIASVIDKIFDENIYNRSRYSSGYAIKRIEDALGISLPSRGTSP